MNTRKDNIGIFIKTCKKDHNWLKWCLASIEKNAEEFDGLCVVTDTDDDLIDNYLNIIHRLNGKIVKVKEPETNLSHNCQDGLGYIWMQNIKLLWNNYCDFDAVLQIDSDCIIEYLLTPNYFIANDKYKWFVRSWGMAEKAQIHREPLNKILGKNSRYEHMPYSVWLLTKEDTLAFHDWFKQKHGCSWWDHILNTAQQDWGKDIEDPVLRDMGIKKTRGSSVYNAYGGFLELYSKNYCMIDVDEIDLEPFPVKQYWSWGKLSGEIIDEIQNKLTTNYKINKLIQLDIFELFNDEFYIKQYPEAYSIINQISNKYSNKEKLFYHYYVLNQDKNKCLNNEEYEKKILGEIIVDTNFNHKFYAKAYPGTEKYFSNTKIRIPDRKRLYHHYILYGNNQNNLLSENSTELGKKLTLIDHPIPSWFKSDIYESICPEVAEYQMPQWEYIPLSYRYYHHYLNYGQHTRKVFTDQHN